MKSDCSTHVKTIAGAGDVTVHTPPLPITFGTHHSKAFILSHAGGLRVIIHTANLIHNDNTTKSQSLWHQDFPPKPAAAAAAAAAREPAVESDFERELRQYLYALSMPYAEQTHMLQLVKGHDFSAARAALLTSVPGYHKADRMHRYGHLRVRALLAQQPDLIPIAQEAPLVAQFSSIGSIDEKWLLEEWGPSFAASLQPAVGTPVPAPAKLQPGHLCFVWPTVEEVRESFEGWGAGGSICGSGENVCKPFIAKYWRRFGGEPHGRHRAAPHIKSYLRHHGQRVLWYILTSSNMSKAAWGALQKSGSQLMVRSYEMGVLLLPSLEASYRASGQAGFCCTPSHPPLTHALPSRAPPPHAAHTAVPRRPPAGTSAAAHDGNSSRGVKGPTVKVDLCEPSVAVHAPHRDARGKHTSCAAGTNGIAVSSAGAAALARAAAAAAAAAGAAAPLRVMTSISGQAAANQHDQPEGPVGDRAAAAAGSPTATPPVKHDGPAGPGAVQQSNRSPQGVAFYSLASHSGGGVEGASPLGGEEAHRCYLPLPYLLPPLPYQAGDQPWGWHQRPTGPDALGQLLERE
ncbi:MAG: hypothetical protein WDW38_003976 [Sanguina aurantia]